MEQIKTAGVGRIIAVIVFVLAIVFAAIGKLDVVEAGMIAALALAVIFG